MICKKGARWNPQLWAERTRMLDAAERGVLVDLKNMLFMRAQLMCSKTEQMAASMDTWALVMRMSTDRVRMVFTGLEAAGVVKTIPKPLEATDGCDVLTVKLLF